MRFLSVFNALGAIVFVFGLTMLVPVGVSWWTADGAQTAYDESIVVTLFAGAALWLATRRKQRVELREVGALVFELPCRLRARARGRAAADAAVRVVVQPPGGARGVDLPLFLASACPRAARGIDVRCSGDGCVPFPSPAPFSPAPVDRAIPCENVSRRTTCAGTAPGAGR